MITLIQMCEDVYATHGLYVAFSLIKYLEKIMLPR